MPYPPMFQDALESNMSKKELHKKLLADFSHDDEALALMIETMELGDLNETQLQLYKKNLYKKSN